MVLLGLDGLPDLGTMPAEHCLPDTARANPLGSATHHVDEQTAHRYAEVSGDWSEYHFGIEAARVEGFDFVFAGIEERSFAFEAAADGATTITHGRLELRT